MEPIIDLLSSSGYVTYSKSIARELGIAEAVILGELCSKYKYWHERGDLEENGGWFYALQSDIEHETGLSPFQQRGAISKLRSHGLIECKKRGQPAQNWYTINPERLNDWLSRNLITRNEVSSPLVVKKLDDSYRINKNKNNTTTPSARTGAREEGDYSLPESQKADLRRIGESYEKEIGEIPSSAAYEFQQYYLQHGISADVIIKAIISAAENNVRTWPYIRSILERCVSEKLISLEDWEKSELRRKNRQSRFKPSGEKPGQEASYDMEEISRMITNGEL